jgi:hypothetical protein
LASERPPFAIWVNRILDRDDDNGGGSQDVQN